MTQATARRRLDTITLGLVSLAMLLAGGAAYVDKRGDDRRDDCIERYANQMADALEARTDTVAPKDQAERRFYHALLGLTKGQDTRAAAEKAIQDYVAADNKLQQERAANPYPAPPREVCPRG